MTGPASFFIAVLPGFFYLIFGAAQEYADETTGNGNVAMFIMIAMAAYGAVSATVGIGGRAATERLQGGAASCWLTPLSDATYVGTRTALAVVVSAVPLAVVFALGALTGARAPLGARSPASRCCWSAQWCSRSTDCASGCGSVPRRR